MKNIPNKQGVYLIYLKDHEGIVHYYIGSSSNLRKRYQQHKTKSLNGVDENTLYPLMRKYPYKFLVIETFLNISRDTLYLLEYGYIKKCFNIQGTFSHNKNSKTTNQTNYLNNLKQQLEQNILKDLVTKKFEYTYDVYNIDGTFINSFINTMDMERFLNIPHNYVKRGVYKQFIIKNHGETYTPNYKNKYTEKAVQVSVFKKYCLKNNLNILDFEKELSYTKGTAYYYTFKCKK